MRKVGNAAPVAADVSMSDSESSEEEDLLSSNGSQPPPPPQIPPTVARTEDLDADCDEDSLLDPPGLPEPVKIATNHEVLDAKHALKESLQNAPPPTKADAFLYILIEFLFFPLYFSPFPRPMLFFEDFHGSILQRHWLWGSLLLSKRLLASSSSKCLSTRYSWEGFCYNASEKDVELTMLVHVSLKVL